MVLTNYRKHIQLALHYKTISCQANEFCLIMPCLHQGHANIDAYAYRIITQSNNDMLSNNKWKLRDFVQQQPKYAWCSNNITRLICVGMVMTINILMELTTKDKCLPPHMQEYPFFTYGNKRYIKSTKSAPKYTGCIHGPPRDGPHMQE